MNNKTTLLILSLFAASTIEAQIDFRPTIELSNFDQTTQGSMAFADVDGDDDLDVLITGLNSSYEQIAKLYINNGSGTYTEMPDTPFEGVYFSSVAFADIDGDNDMDLIISGYLGSERSTTLYTNDGSGNYAEVADNSFPEMDFGDIAFADVDGDNDMDVLFSGDGSTLGAVTKLFTNDGNGIFTEVTDTPFEQIAYGSIAFTDVDGDNDMDVLMTGRNDSNIPLSKLYTNDGSGNFTEVTDTPFEDVHLSTVSFIDVDSDNDMDVLITGVKDSSDKIAKLYTNDGSGNYTEVSDTPFDGVQSGSVDIADIDNDNDMDVFLTGYNNSSEAISKLYTNDGSGNYTEVDIPLEGIYNSSIAFADVDDDNDLDVLMMGTDNSFTWHTTLYTNDGSGNYMEVIEAPFEDVSRSEIAFADIDGDNDIDALITGKNNSDQNITKLYSNDGNGIFTEVTDTPFEQIAYGSITFTDVDGDNDLDVLMTGRNNSNQNITKLYSNDGNGNFTEVTDTPFEGVESSAVAFADIDGDNDMDVLMTGSNNSNQNITKLYSNDGNGNFTQVADTPFEATSGGSVAFADIDGDNDMDVLIAGLNDSYQTTTNLYTNDGSGNFTEVADTPFENIYVGIVKFVDMDGDNDMDVFISGENNSFQSTSKAYTNDGGGNYTEIADTPFIGLLNSKAIFIDVDGDTDMDLILTGFNIGSTESYSKLYTNDGNGNYTEVTETSFVGLGQGDLAAADVDGDNDIDIMITGYNTTTESRISKLYFNHTAQAVFATDEQLACNTFTWIDDISYTEDNTTAQHTLIGEAANGGDSIVTLNLTINTVSDLSTSVDVATITANNENGTYQWLDCDNDYSIIEGATEMSFSPTVNGNYAVEIIENGNACIDTTSCVSITTVGLIENKINNAVVYPNPTDGAFNISLQSVLEEIHITVFNIVGRKVHAATYSNTNSIDLELNQPSGVYFVEIRTKEDSNTIQLIKK